MIIKVRIGMVFYIMASVAFILGLLISNSIADDIDKETREISYLLMCPVCEGQTVAESNSQLAKQMRTIIREKLQEGKSKDEIIAYFVSRYGEAILGAPPAKGVNWILWTLPALSLLVGGLIIGLFLYKLKEDREKSKKESRKPPTQFEPEYIEKLNKELREFES
ncbi:MAG: cytochrome C biogenesis protein CcmH [Candidatus Dadabacteria bacterium]